jgi:hypothetical protein
MPERIQTIFFPDFVIRDYLKKYWKGAASKDYELLVSLVLNKFCSDQYKTQGVIGFQLKDSQAKNVPKSGLATLEELKNIFDNYIDSYTPLDVMIGVEKTANGIMRGPGFQLKRFGRDPKKTDTDALVDYINEIGKKYGKVNASLCIILETSKEIDFEKIQKSINITSYPFFRIMFIALSDGKIMIIELWPNSGMEEYSQQDFLN